LVRAQNYRSEGHAYDQDLTSEAGQMHNNCKAIRILYLCDNTCAVKLNGIWLTGQAIKLVQGASKIKLKKKNKKRMDTVRRVIIFLNILRYP
jgi:hypothetical protein